MEKEKINISGIQQVGIGVKNVKDAWQWYKKYFGFDVRVFEDRATANFMLPYTGNKPQSRYAALTLNMQGGGGLEIWQYTERIPQPPLNPVLLGDLGIFCVKLRTHNCKKAYNFFKSENLNILTDIESDPRGCLHFYLKDPFDNIFEIIENDKNWFKNEKKLTSGVFGLTIGCSDIEKSIQFYSKILGYETNFFLLEDSFNDWNSLPSQGKVFKRAILSDKGNRKGVFSKLFGNSEIELAQNIDNASNCKQIYENRFWGDLGFIHACFDITDMDELREKCKNYGYPFTVDSSKEQEGKSFDMGTAKGFFSYIEDPDKALIEFVETHKISILKWPLISISLLNRDRSKPLPNFFVKALGLNRF